MSEIMKKKERKQLQATNLGLQLLIDRKQTSSSSTIFLQWCAMNPVLDYLRATVKNPLLFVRIFDAQNRESRYLFDFASKQEVILFHSAGVHTIKAEIIWGVKKRIAKAYLLDKRHGGWTYKSTTPLLGSSSRKRQYAIGLKTFGSANIEIEVPASSFAPQLSGWEEWYINLWFPTIARNSCSINRRRFVAYFPLLKPLAIIGYLVAVTITRLVYAFGVNALFAMRGDWSPVIHPFEQDWEDINGELGKNFSWIAWRKDGTTRWWSEFSLVLTPIAQFILSCIALIVMGVNGWEKSLLNFGWGYLLTVLGILSILLLLFVIFTVFDNFSQWIAQSIEKLHKWFRIDPLGHLSCQIAPHEGLRQVSFTPRYMLQGVKGKFCKPAAI